MYDTRLAWIRSLISNPEKIAVVASARTGDEWIKCLENLWKSDGQPRLFTVHDCGTSFIPLSRDELEKSGCEIIVYLIRSRESAGAIKSKLSSVSQFDATEYTVFPNWLNPKWFVPGWRSLGPGKMSPMIQPSRPVARAVVTVFRLMKVIGRAHFFFPCRLIIARNGKNILLENKRTFFNFFQGSENGIRTGIIYTGSYGPLQKYTVELLRRNGEPFAYTKFGQNELTKLAIANERKWLKMLSSCPFSTVKIPQLIDLELPKALFQQVLIVGAMDEGKKITTAVEPIINGLAELYNLTKEAQSISIKKYIRSEAQALGEQDCTGIEPELKKIRNDVMDMLIGIGLRVSDSAMLRLSLSHGDFTRWNVRGKNKKIHLIDWEEAAMRPPGHDLLSFLLAERLLARSNPPEKSAIHLFHEITEGRLRKYLSLIDLDGLFSATLFGAFFLGSTLRTVLWHIRLHTSMKFPYKPNLYEVAKTCASCMHLLVNDDYDL